MSRIEKILNKSILADLTNTPGSFYFNTNLYFAPDEVIIRQISYNGPNVATGHLCLVWCSIINDYIGSFAVSDSTSSSINVFPNAVIKCLPNNINQSLQFHSHTIDASGVGAPSTTLTGKLVINFDFIKYKV